ncbi:chloride channel protein [Legionella hackeliae]|uniref:Putative Chloride channel protein n=1 Tax=Legionella hackeliae TaxID=449 RepID=A0A0A8UWX8_LEGHA|nr:chloride channel protein [Legionella hackeliae]KTD12625.1 chloride channel protein [Legionella hackeliae]CEK12041.1 putative Chloride channel protein [Legionella hackeliae]STX48827.1 chloride channel protein [Legionella hackeliae]
MTSRSKVLSSESPSKDFANSKILALAAFGGLFIGAAVAGIRLSVGFIQTILFGTNVDLYSPATVPSWRIMLVTLIGGVFLGWLLLTAGRFKRLAIVDPVEANALEGGKMSLGDSLILVGLSVVSITIGGSVGFEAAMTQLGAGCLSFIGQRLKLERRDLRILVSCGTGAGIAAIFGAPLAGTFYALELVVGGYAMRALLPTLLASAMSSHIIYILIGYQPIFLASDIGPPALWHFPLAIITGIAAALIGIAVMRGTTSFEKFLSSVHAPTIVKPVVGGLLLGLISLRVPEVMGPGHHSINEILSGSNILGGMLVLLLAKIAASVACVGSGFRGGLFSASLFLGATLGYLVHGLLLVPIFGPTIPLDLAVVAGMAGVATSIIGTPIAIVLLMVETAGLQTGVVTTAITVIIASHLTRYWFGYSFSTWRFHIRGNDLLGPRDIGRLRELTFGDLQLNNPPRVSLETSIDSALAITTATDLNVIALEERGRRFAGLISCNELLETFHSTPVLPLCNLARKPKFCVRKNEPLINYVEKLGENSAGEIAVLDENEQLIGLASEAAVLHRYLMEILAADRDDAIQIINK